MLYQTLTINQLNQVINELLAVNLSIVSVKGEVASITIASSGHWYVTLKDATSQIKAVMFKNKALYASFVPKIGQEIELLASVEMYASRGDIQLIIDTILPIGDGELHELFLATKNKLAKLGMFEASNKKPLPNINNIHKVGIITSLEAAALQDILATLKIKLPHIEIYIYPCLVQGIYAYKTIIEQIELANQEEEHKIKVDVLIVCRGGGSKQDLATYNNEELAISIYNSDIPIISAVGHETDISIVDMVANARVATPTASVDLLGINNLQKLNYLHLTQQNFKNLILNKIKQQNFKLQNLCFIKDKLINRLRRQQLSLEYYQQSLKQNFNNKIKSLYLIQEKYKNLLNQYNPYNNSLSFLLTDINNKLIENYQQLYLNKSYYLHFKKNNIKVKIQVQEIINE